ncbi:hypothetical protein PSNIH1_00625 [Pantoea sp. PSNIH1]|nr:hypothetical protein PSNIH1_00625 [Pantoea sp. PSNIH1]
MNKLTAENCREQFEEWASNGGAFPRAIERRDGEYILLATQSQWTVWQASRAALEIALPVLEQQEKACQKCGGSGAMDSGTEMWGDTVYVDCDCVVEQQEKGNDGRVDNAGVKDE